MFRISPTTAEINFAFLIFLLCYSEIVMKKGFALPLILAVVILFVATASFAAFNFKPNNSFPLTKLVKQKLESKCEFYGQLDKEFYLDKYIVQKGDTLLSIAQNQLGDNSRVDELIQLNRQTYPSISIQNPKIEANWELEIPAKIYPKSSGIIESVGGKVTGQNSKSITINLKRDSVVEQISYFNSYTKFLSVNAFKIGDCVYIVKDGSARAEAGILAISPQGKNYFKSEQGTEVKQQKRDKCEFYGFLDKDFFLTKYTVQKGDNISSVAQKELGDATRTEELIQLTKPWYPHLTDQTPFIEVGWQLRVPPKMLTKSSGALVGIGGEIIEKTDSTISINLAYNQAGIDDGYFSHVNTTTKNIGKSSFNVGDCIYAVEDTGINADFILGISPQDRNYFK